jgi:hypothetical protein
MSSIKSNQAIAEELNRLLMEYFPTKIEHCCSNPTCANAQHPVETHPKAYYAHGKSSFGAQRYRCRLCRGTFSVRAKVAFKQKKPQINELIFRLLVNKMPMRRICETVDIHPATLYGKIDFIYNQCLAYAGYQEQIFRDAPSVRRLYLALDRQDYIFNWGTQLDRRNVMLHAIGTSDNASGYVFGMHLDFDARLDAEVIEKAAIAEGDYEQQYAYRRYARLWLQRDYDDSHHLLKRLDAHRNRGTIDGPSAAIKLKKLQALQEMNRRQVGSDIELDTKAPAVGMQVRVEYTMYAHLFYLRDLLKNVEKIRIFMDQEPGVKAACFAAFGAELAERRIDAFFVRIRKDMSTDEKKMAKGRSEILLAKVMRDHPELTREAATRQTMLQMIKTSSVDAEDKEKWVQHPFPDMGEPEKAVCYLTDYGDYEADHLANLYLKASLRSIDRFFMQVRRRMSIFERPISSASGKKTWHGYSAYNPAVGAKLLAIFRVFYNYALPGEDKKTPAMRLGIAARAATLADILEFHPASMAGMSTQTSPNRNNRDNSGSTNVTG